ncbi:MAG: hypothetical protein Ta2B_04480 [Termitinemataceae bacterium]|nr:MAG: hypothetical protein Ta2B_04480 [Termitinemataceae bacterium]
MNDNENEKKIIAIGKFLFDSYKTTWSIPHLHFLVENPYAGHFEAINLEFGLVASGKEQKESVQRLASLIHFHVTSIMSNGLGYKEFIDTVKSDFMDDYWTAYRVIEFKLAEKGKDLSHEIERLLTRAIQEMLNKQIKNEIIKKAGDKAEQIIRDYEDATTLKLMGVEYQEILVA